MLRWLTEHGATLIDLARLHQLQIESPRLRELGEDIQRASSQLAALAAAIEEHSPDEQALRRAAKRALAAIEATDDKLSFREIIARKLHACEFPIENADATTLRTYSGPLAKLASFPETVIAQGYADQARALRGGSHGRLRSLALQTIAEAADRYDVPSMAIARVIVGSSRIMYPRLKEKKPATWAPAAPGDDEFLEKVTESAAIERWARAIDDARYTFRRTLKNRRKRRNNKAH